MFTSGINNPYHFKRQKFDIKVKNTIQTLSKNTRVLIGWLKVFWRCSVLIPAPYISLAPSTVSPTCPLGVQCVTENINPQTKKKMACNGPNEVWQEHRAYPADTQGPQNWISD